MPYWESGGSQVEYDEHVEGECEQLPWGRFWVLLGSSPRARFYSFAPDVTVWMHVCEPP